MVSDVLIGIQPPLTGLEMTMKGSDLEKKSLFSSLCPLRAMESVSPVCILALSEVRSAHYQGFTKTASVSVRVSRSGNCQSEDKNSPG